MREGTTVLIVEDEPGITEFLETGLSYEGYEVIVVPDGRSALDLLPGKGIDLVVLDIMLPDIDGFEVCRRIRKRDPDLPVLMLTARREIPDRVKGLDVGADDYMVKPFSFAELVARIRALLRRYGRRAEVELRGADIVMNVETHHVERGGRPVRLTPTEFSLLELFLRHPRRVFTRDTLLNRVLGYDFDGGTNLIDVHVSHLRSKLGDRPPRLIRTYYGVGYAFHPEAA